MFYWINNFPINVYWLTGCSKGTTVDWFSLCRDVCYSLFNNRNNIGGLGEVVQIDEFLLRGKRKYHRGQFSPGNQSAENLTSDSDFDKENIANRTK